ncbi:peptidase [Cellulomonas humilata]|uniref:Peptidase n=1 Tax=Cellulomonas humilata TaxID=144055 RepID=A0ABU0EAL7_9CELL|nr:peptidase [Cellulomonas humilata]MDQ0372100.1 hypothetical protein [Cellulomonas humilata]
MVRLVRSAVVALVAVLVALVGALPASAGDDNPSASPSPTAQVYGCINPVDGYGAPRACQLLIQVLAPVCDNDVPKLKYTVNPVGTPNDKVTITFINPSGPSVVYADQPLTGTVLWPGAVPGPDGRGIDWPGWRQLPNGTWVEGDEFDWVRPSVKVKFEVNPEETVTVAYPPSSPSCNTNPPTTVVLVDDPKAVVLVDSPSSATLSATGSETQPLIIAGGALILIGALAVALVSIARRRRPTT